jgi:hypothetical protein
LHADNQVILTKQVGIWLLSFQISYFGRDWN